MSTAPNTSPPWQTDIEAIAQQLPGSVQENWRRLIYAVRSNLQAALPGGALVTAGGSAAGSTTPPAGVTMSVAGANGAYTVTIVNPPASGGSGQAPWHEVSYSPLKSFSAQVTTLEPSQSTSVAVSLPGQTLFFRRRSSWDRNTWSAYQLASQTPAPSGLQSSAATSDAVNLNQTNFAVVTSAAAGSTTEVSVQGPSAPLTNPVRQKGPAQTTLPGGTIYGVAPNSDQFVVYNGGYLLRPTLAGALSDDANIPVGKVSVVGTGAPELPEIAPIVSGGGVVGYNVTNQGNGITGPLTLTVTDPGESGNGATTGAQTIVNGKLIAVAPGNAGANYGANTAVQVSGGVNPGTPGGGTASGGNGGRMTDV